MTILLITHFKEKSYQVPLILIGLIIDGFCLYGLYDLINYHLNYFN